MKLLSYSVRIGNTLERRLNKHQATGDRNISGAKKQMNKLISRADEEFAPRTMLKKHNNKLVKASKQPYL